LAQRRFHIYGNRYGYFRSDLCCDFGANLRSNFSALYEWHWNHYW
jgi:hypothetical protein